MEYSANLKINWKILNSFLIKNYKYSANLKDIKIVFSLNINGIFNKFQKYKWI
jgi:hypothetical protein